MGGRISVMITDVGGDLGEGVYKREGVCWHERNGSTEFWQLITVI